MIFFKGRDQDAIHAAFRDFSTAKIKKANKNTIRKRLQKYRAMVAQNKKARTEAFRHGEDEVSARTEQQSAGAENPATEKTEYGTVRRLPFSTLKIASAFSFLRKEKCTRRLYRVHFLTFQINRCAFLFGTMSKCLLILSTLSMLPLHQSSTLQTDHGQCVLLPALLPSFPCSAAPGEHQKENRRHGATGEETHCS